MALAALTPEGAFARHGEAYTKMLGAVGEISRLGQRCHTESSD